MSDSESQSNITSNIRESSKITSLRPECLEKLRNPNSSHKPPTHLLAYMSEFLEEKQQNQAQQVDEFCCFDRIKRLLHKKKNSGFIASDQDENSKITKVIQLEAKMKKMQQTLQKYTQPSLLISNKNNSSYQSGSIQSLGNSKIKKYRKANPNISRQTMIDKLKDQAYVQYSQHQKQKIIDNQNIMKQSIGQQIQKKVDKVLSDRDIAFNQLVGQKKKLERTVLQKDLELQSLKSKQSQLLKRIQDLQIYRQLVSQTEDNKKRQTQNQKLAKQFIYTFPDMSVSDVQRQIENLNDKCLKKFNDIQCKNWEKWNEQKTEYLNKIKKLEDTVKSFKKKENQLLQNINVLRYEHGLATLEVDSLVKDKNQLENIHKKILSVYNDWYGARSQTQKSLMKNLGYLRQNYEYEQMLDYIVTFREKISTNDKVNDYLIKILRGIMRIRKILFPKQNNEKLDPLDLLDKLESYVKAKVYQKLYKKGANFKAKSSQKMKEELMFLTQSKDNKQNEELIIC